PALRRGHALPRWRHPATAIARHGRTPRAAASSMRLRSRAQHEAQHGSAACREVARAAVWRAWTRLLSGILACACAWLVAEKTVYAPAGYDHFTTKHLFWAILPAIGAYLFGL